MARKKFTKGVNKVLNKNMPSPLKPNNLLKNRFVLYVAAIVSVLNVIKFVFKEEFEYLFLFVLIALVSCNFSKNMIVNLLSAIIGTNLVYLVANNRTINLRNLLLREGMNGGEGENGYEEEQEQEPMESGPKKENGAKCHKHEDGKWIAHAIDCKDCDEAKKKEKCKSLGKNYDFCVEGSCNAEAFVSSDIPSSEPASLENKSVDSKSTVEQSYDNLEKVIGGDNIRKLTGDTKKLMDQQKSLVNSLKDIGPVLEQSSKIMKDLPIEQMTKMLSNIGK